ncbi:MAG: hypothetical protein IJX99_07725 [Clostridia bacterium]|nr:hypothetical protein [Clostridia bacterium]
MYIFKMILGGIFSIFGPLGLIIALLLINRYTQKFVVEPLAKYLSINNDKPYNYMYQQIRKTRLTILVISVLMNFSLIYFVELGAILYSFTIVKRIKSRKYPSDIKLVEEDYLIYDEYFRELEEKEEKNEDQVEDLFDEYDEIMPVKKVKIKDFKKIVKEKDNTNKTNEIVLETENSIESFEDENKIEIKQEIQEEQELKPDEIRCEKCGEIMSKNKIVCLKCGTLVKINNKNGRN